MLMRAHDAEKDVLIVGAAYPSLREVNMTMFRSLPSFKYQDRYPYFVACHVPACVLVDIHVYEASCKGSAYFDHA